MWHTTWFLQDKAWKVLGSHLSEEGIMDDVLNQCVGPNWGVRVWESKRQTGGDIEG